MTTARTEKTTWKTTGLWEDVHSDAVMVAGMESRAIGDVVSEILRAPLKKRLAEAMKKNYGVDIPLRLKRQMAANGKGRK